MEAALFFDGQRLPDVLCHWTQRIDHRAPIDSRFARLFDLSTYQSHEPTRGTGRAPVPELRPGFRRLKTLRQQTVTGNDVDVSPKVARLERHGEINAGKAGTDQQHRTGLRKVFKRAS